MKPTQKHTFSVKTVDQNDNSIINLIVVETVDGIYEYFLKYTFEGKIPFTDKGLLDLSEFTGTIESFDNNGAQTGTLIVESGQVIDFTGRTDPCANTDGLWEGWDDYENDTEFGGTSGNNTSSDDEDTSSGNNDVANTNNSNSSSGSTGSSGCDIYYVDSDGERRELDEWSPEEGAENCCMYLVINCPQNEVISTMVREDEDPCEVVMVGVMIDEEAMIENIQSCLDNDFNSSWFIDYSDYIVEVYNFIVGNCSEENSAFLALAMEAIEEGGEVDFDDKVILDPSFVNNEMLKCAFDKLASDNSPLFRDTIGLFIEDPQFNLTFQVGECATTEDQCTNSSDPYNIVITFEDVSNNPIEVAQAILHEAIHAEIARFVEQSQTGVDVNDRPYLFQLYAYYKGWADSVDPDHNWTNSGDHHFMVTNYINNLANTLKEFDNHRFPFVDNYKDYAWDGLRKYGYDSGQLTEEEENYLTNLREQTNIDLQVCNE